MAQLFNPEIWPVLGESCNAQQTRLEWFSTLGPVAFQTAPLLKVDGERAGFIRCPETGMRLELHENWDSSFSALPPADTELDSRVDGLNLEDLLLYELDWPQILQGVQTMLSISGPIHCLDYNPPLWSLGIGDGGSYFFAVLNAPSALDETFKYLQSSPQSRLLLPSISNQLFSALLKNGIQCHALDSGVAPTFPSVDQGKGSLYRIQRPGVGWKIVFDGQETMTGNWGGMRFVEYLLKNPPAQPVHVTNLAAAVSPFSKNFSGISEIIDPEKDELVSVERESVLQERSLGIDDKESEIELWKILQQQKEIAANPACGASERAIAEEQVSAIEAYLKNTLTQEKSGANLAFDRVRNSINRLLEKLRDFSDDDGDPDPVFVQFADHLDEYLIKPSRRYSSQRDSRSRAKVAQTFTYEPPPGVIWTD